MFTSKRKGLAVVLVAALSATSIQAFAQSQDSDSITVQSNRKSWSTAATAALDKELARYRYDGRTFQTGTAAYAGNVQMDGKITDIEQIWSSVSRNQNSSTRKAINALQLTQPSQIETSRPVIFIVRFEVDQEPDKIDKKTYESILRAAQQHFVSRSQMAVNPVIIHSGG